MGKTVRSLFVCISIGMLINGIIINLCTQTSKSIQFYISICNHSDTNVLIALLSLSSLFNVQ